MSKKGIVGGIGRNFAVLLAAALVLAGCARSNDGGTQTGGGIQAEAGGTQTGGGDQEEAGGTQTGGGDQAETGGTQTGGGDQEEAGGTQTGGGDQAETGGTQTDYEALFDGWKPTKGFKGMIDANPILTQHFGADPYAMVYGDRVYFYMTADAFEYDTAGEVKENTYGSIKSLYVASTSDMVNFTDHGEIRVAGPKGAAKWAHNSWAPAAAWKEIDGKPKFFLYFADNGGGIGVLTSDSPTGPFQDELGKALITRQTPNCGDVLWLFDPAVLVDDDGRAYLYFGGGVPEGKIDHPCTGRAVELGEDMMSIVGEPVVIDAPYMFEDSGIHKAGDKYYYTYCSNWQVDDAGTDRYGFHSAEIVSMESDSPLGPFTVKETILQNPGRAFGLYGNNHHCVFSFQDRWYIAYHSRVMEKKMGVERGYRSTHVEEFAMGEDGTIGTIPLRLQGREQVNAFSPYEEINGATMAVMAGVEIVPADEVSAEKGCGNMAVGGIDTKDYVKLQGVDFGEKSPVELRAGIRCGNGGGVIRVSADYLNGDVLCYIAVEPGTTEFTDCIVPLTGTVTGVHDVYFSFYGEGYEIACWQFR